MESDCEGHWKQEIKGYFRSLRKEITWCKRHFGRLTMCHCQGGREQGGACSRGKHSINVCHLVGGVQRHTSRKTGVRWENEEKHINSSKDTRVSQADRKCRAKRSRATASRAKWDQTGREKLGGEASLEREELSFGICSCGGWSVCTRVFMWLCSKARLWHKPCAVPVSPPSHCAPPPSWVSFSANKNKITHKINGNNLPFACHRGIFFLITFFLCLWIIYPVAWLNPLEVN